MKVKKLLFSICTIHIVKGVRGLQEKYIVFCTSKQVTTIYYVYAQEQYGNVGDRIWRSVEMEVM